MLNPINEMRRLSSASYDDLLRIATAMYDFCPNGARFSKIEIITYIVAMAAIRDQSASRFLSEQIDKCNRTRYRFREMDDTEHYVELTPEQERFMRWNQKNAINYDNINIDVIEDIKWEKP